MNRPGTNDTEKERAASALTAEMQKHISSFYAVFLIFAVSAYGSVRLTIEFGEDAGDYWLFLLAFYVLTLVCFYKGMQYLQAVRELKERIFILTGTLPAAYRSFRKVCFTFAGILAAAGCIFLFLRIRTRQEEKRMIRKLAAYCESYGEIVKDNLVIRDFGMTFEKEPSVAAKATFKEHEGQDPRYTVHEVITVTLYEDAGFDSLSYDEKKDHLYKEREQIYDLMDRLREDELAEYEEILDYFADNWENRNKKDHVKRSADYAAVIVRGADEYTLDMPSGGYYLKNGKIVNRPKPRPSGTAAPSAARESSNSYYGTSNGSGSKSSSSGKKHYMYDPADYDDPEEYADDAWGTDFDDWDEAYEYWEDY